MSFTRLRCEQSLNTRLFLLLVLLLPALASAERAGDSGSFSSPTLRLHEQAEELYRNGHPERAYFIYVNELAVIGDKYAQYMAGYMCLNGKGVPRDPIKASAWYRLAAERGAPEFVEVRDQLLESMSEAQRDDSDIAFLKLRQEYSDLAIALGYLSDERELLDERSTGSHLNSNSSSITVIDPRTGVTMTRSEYVGRLESRIQVRLDYITARLGIDRLEADMNDREFADLSARVDAYLQVIDDR